MIPLPEPARTHDRHGHLLLIGPCYTADQMHAHAAAARRQALEEAARVIERTYGINAAAIRSLIDKDTA